MVQSLVTQFQTLSPSACEVESVGTRGVSRGGGGGTDETAAHPQNF